MKNLKVKAEKNNLSFNFNVFWIEWPRELSSSNSLFMYSKRRQTVKKTSPFARFCSFLCYLHHKKLASLINFSVAGVECRQKKKNKTKERKKEIIKYQTLPHLLNETTGKDQKLCILQTKRQMKSGLIKLKY